jgi:predicted  nucleic acid-binding Zn-ribbon protein
MKMTFFAVLATCSIGLCQAWGEVANPEPPVSSELAAAQEQAKAAFDEATDWASKAAELAAQGHAQMKALDDEIARLEAEIKKLESDNQADTLPMLRIMLKNLKDAKLHATPYLTNLDAAASAAAAAAAAAQEALKSLTNALTPEQIRDFLALARVQAGNAKAGHNTANSNLNSFFSSIKQDGFTSMLISSGSLLNTGTTPTPVGQGRR